MQVWNASSDVACDECDDAKQHKEDIMGAADAVHQLDLSTHAPSFIGCGSGCDSGCSQDADGVSC